MTSSPAWEVRPVRSLHRTDGISATILIPFLFFAIQTTRGIMFWRNNSSAGDASAFDAVQANIEGSPLDRIVLSALILLALFTMRKRLDKVGMFLKNNYMLLILLGFMALSILWSDFKLVSLKRWVRCVGVVVMVMMIFTEEHPLRNVVKLIEMLALFLIGGSLVLIFLVPSIGTEVWSSGEVSWIGLATHKNMLGQYGAMGSIFFLWRFFCVKEIRQKLYYLTLLAVALSGLILVGSRSFTSISVTFIGMMILLLFVLSRRFGKLGWVAVFLITASVVTATLFVQTNLTSESFAGYLLESGGKDLTFTGRTDIWKQTLKNVDGREAVIGTGYESYWLTPKADRIRYLLDWDFFSAHNGYIETFLQLGAFGLLFLGLFLLSTIVNISKSKKESYELCMLWTAFLVISLVSNVFESNFLVASDLYWMLTIFASVNPKCFHADGYDVAPDLASAPPGGPAAPLVAGPFMAG
jgi:O-antigen ligase